MLTGSRPKEVWRGIFYQKWRLSVVVAGGFDIRIGNSGIGVSWRHPGKPASPSRRTRDGGVHAARSKQLGIKCDTEALPSCLHTQLSVQSEAD